MESKERDKVAEDKGKSESTETKKSNDKQVLNEMFAKPEIVVVGEMDIKVQPAPLGELNRVSKILVEIDKIGLTTDDGEIPEKAAKIMAEFIHDAIKAYHEYSVDFIIAHFPLSSFPDFVEARIQSNRFFTKMRKIQGNIPQLVQN